MNWLEMLRGQPGRLAVVRRLSDAEAGARQADLKEHGDVVCAGCGWQGFARHGVEGDAIYHGAFRWNEAAKRFDLPGENGGRCVYECPRCRLVDDTRSDERTSGLMFLGGWLLMKGEWQLATCSSENCAGRGAVFAELACPGCGELCLLHHASNGPPNAHGWTIQVADGDILTVNPSVLHGSCHFFVRENQVQWC